MAGGVAWKPIASKISGGASATRSVAAGILTDRRQRFVPHRDHVGRLLEGCLTSRFKPEAHRNACSKSPIRSSVFSSPTEMRNKLSGVRVFGPSTDARCSIKLCVPPRLVARVKSRTFAATCIARSRPPRNCNDNMPPHPAWQRVYSAQDQPAIEGRRCRTAELLRLARPLKQVVLMFGDQRAAHHIAVPTDIFRRRVQHHVDAPLERPLEDWRSECSVAHADSIGTAAD